jgi:hypothetical protein
MSQSDSEHDDKNIDVDWTETEGAGNLEQILGVKYMPNNPESIPEAVDLFLGNELFQLFVNQSSLYHRQNSDKCRPLQNC